jgi:DNA polymerase III subunit gamma/tau
MAPGYNPPRMAEAYTVLARRYRSQTFDELVGQETIAQTLKNAIRTNHVAHAFLFTGTRGVGKTSAARILAKAINCPKRGADGNPCGECNSCKAIARGDDLDVIEIDGASNNGVDNIRELRQAAGIRPARSPFKIYIIDEVHMVTTNAFNALLKTLEEPPEHVKFIFATTEVGKVPATILSRCQRFDFKNIATARIVEHLKRIVADEKITADEEALHRIARLGNGSMRDALSILDRVLSLGEKHISDKTLEDLLGKPATAAVAELVQALAGGDAAGALTRGDKLLQEGMGAEQILSELIEFLRNLMLVATCGKETDLLDVPAEARAMYAGLAGKYDAPTLVHLMALCEQGQRSLKASAMHRPLLDALLVRLALAEQFTSLRELLASGSAAKETNPPIAGQKKKQQ